MIGKPSFTIVTPSFNQAVFLEATMRSVLEQEYPHVEYMVIDGGSTDGSVEIIRRYADRLSYWVSEPDRGQSHAINKGLARARGSIVAYLNSDDCYLPGALARAAAQFQAHPKVDVVYGAIDLIDAEGRILADRLYDAREFTLETVREVISVIPQPAAFIRRKAFRQNGPFREDLHYIMDWEMWIRLALHGVEFRFLEERLAQFRLHSDAKTYRINPRNMAERARILEEHGRHPAAPWREEIAELCGRQYWMAGEIAFRDGQYAEAGRYFVSGARLMPEYGDSERIHVNLPLAMINRFGDGALDKITLFTSYFSDELMSPATKRRLVAATKRLITKRVSGPAGQEGGTA